MTGLIVGLCVSFIVCGYGFLIATVILKEFWRKKIIHLCPKHLATLKRGDMAVVDSLHCSKCKNKT